MVYICISDPITCFELIWKTLIMPYIIVKDNAIVTQDWTVYWAILHVPWINKTILWFQEVQRGSMEILIVKSITGVL